MPDIMKFASILSPFFRLKSYMGRAVVQPIRRIFAPKPSDTIYELGGWNNNATVQTKWGIVRGSSENGTWSWKGIPYATPPIEHLRWKAPRDPIPWIGIRKTTRFGNSASQVMPIMGAM
ncbi:MAG: carboxylesterase family protein, partial [Candidatus Thorarchaeota archaeon]